MSLREGLIHTQHYSASSRVASSSHVNSNHVTLATYAQTDSEWHVYALVCMYMRACVFVCRLLRFVCALAAVTHVRL